MINAIAGLASHQATELLCLRKQSMHCWRKALRPRCHHSFGAAGTGNNVQETQQQVLISGYTQVHMRTTSHMHSPTSCTGQDSGITAFIAKGAGNSRQLLYSCPQQTAKSFQ